MTRYSTFASFAVTLVALTMGLTPASVLALNVPFYTQNFDGLTLGNLNGQDGWGASVGAASVQNTTVVSGQALEAAGGAFGRASIFAPLPGEPRQQMRVDLRLESDINEFAGTPGVDIQHTLLFRGPAADKQFAIVYKAQTFSSGPFIGDVAFSRWEIRGATTTTSPAVVKDVWYSFDILFNFVTNTIDGLVLVDGSPFWDPALQNGFQANGNVNNADISADGDPNVDFFMDNFGVFIPEPASAGAMALMGGLMLLRRRR